jgi:hypothetical protein
MVEINLTTPPTISPSLVVNNAVPKYIYTTPSSYDNTHKDTTSTSLHELLLLAYYTEYVAVTRTCFEKNVGRIKERCKTHEMERCNASRRMMK